ncbi:hypothetical protein PAECIP112173_00534 [Paenibacillus sp. JJ-100]|uniref:alpha/beta hydrolase-fold protein n=1 Tax=Paenibacillus sp. JJ-100 TaxID=2974896 RepID=UPI0022FFBD52|nr:alpha/beta hydrolase-fold protein [Paenibacillus sp. JJ-100]CAI6028340.1 hypothetical protein PAECIP112173_00534 [Paenibacillus sp. JJ-100]
MKKSRSTRKVATKTIPIAALSAVLVLTSAPGLILADSPNVVQEQNSSEVRSTLDTQNSRFYTSTYTSASMDQKEMSYRVYLPEGYYDSTRKYPVVYLLHGENQTSETFEKSRIAGQLDQWIKEGKLQKMIVIMPDTRSEGDVSQKAEGDHDRLEHMIVNDLVPFVDGKYRTINQPQYRAITGISMGGFESFVIGLNHPETFSSIGSHRAPLGLTVAGKNPMTLLKNKTEEELKAYSIYLDGGVDDPNTYADNSTNDIHNYLRSTSISHGYQMRPDHHESDNSIVDLDRSLGAFSSRFGEGLLTGSFTATPQALGVDTETVSVTYATYLDRTAAERFQNGETDVDFNLSIALKVTDPEGNVLYSDRKNVGDIVTGSTEANFSDSFTIPVHQLGNSKSTTVSLEASLLGKSVSLGSKPLIRVTPTGTLPEDLQIDLLGDWKFKKDSHPQPSIQGESEQVDTSDWATVQPGLDWWTDGFGGYEGLNNYYGAAWYQRTFFVPDDFPDEDLTLMAGKIDDADMTYINGVKVGETGFVDGKYQSSFWAASREYKIPSNLLKRGQVNTIAVYMLNDNGGGGWYAGPIGIYTKAAMQKAKNLPSEVPAENIVSAVKELAAKQYQAVDQNNLTSYADTLSPQYFEKGIDKLKLLDKRRQWAKEYKTIQTKISNPYVFALDNRYLYTAEVTITGTKADGTETVLQQGPVSQYYQQESGKLLEIGDQKLFFVTEFYSESAKRLVKYRVYLPQNYLTQPDKRYPSVYLLHQFNSDSESYEIDKVDQILDREIAAGRSKDMIVVIPDSSGLSWWVNGTGPDGVKWQDMVVKDLVPHVDQKFRTIDDARYRGTSGVSMGGFGSFVIGFQYPDLFSSAASHMGALSFTQANQNPVSIVQSYPIEALKRYSIFFDSGNEDVYKFDVPVANLHKYLKNKGVDHYAEIRDGLHDSAFYTKSIDLSFAQHSRHFADAGVADGVLNGNLDIRTVDGTKTAVYKVTANEGVSAYADHIPSSPYIKNQTPDLQMPIILELVHSTTGERVAVQQDLLAARSGNISKEGTLVIPSLANGKYNLILKGSILDRTFTLATATYTVGGSSSDGSGNAGGGSGGNGQSNPPVSTPTIPGTDTSTGINGSFTSEQVATAIQEETDLQIQLSGGTKLTLPYQALKQIASELGANYKSLNVKETSVSSTEQESNLRSAGQHKGGQFKPAGSFKNLGITATLEDGTVRELEPVLTKPGSLELQTDLGTDPLLAGVYYWNDKGEAEFIRSKWNAATRTFEIPLSRWGTYGVMNFTKLFSDIEPSSWYDRAVEVMVAQHIVTGISDTQFAPNKAVTRAEFAALLARMLDLKEVSSVGFTDVSQDRWYASYVAAAHQAGIVNGMSESTFGPDRQITREQMAVMTYNALQLQRSGVSEAGKEALNDFVDGNRTSVWAQSQMGALVQLGLMNGKGAKSIAPQHTASRAEAVQVLYNLMQLKD